MHLVVFIKPNYMREKQPFPCILTNYFNREFPDAKGYFWCLIWAGVGILEKFLPTNHYPEASQNYPKGSII